MPTPNRDYWTNRQLTNYGDELTDEDFDDIDLEFAGVGFETDLIDDWPEETINDSPFQFPVTTYCGSIRNFAI